MRVLHIASEVAPYSMSGGLAEVAGSLPAALSRVDSSLQVAVLSPFYRSVARRKIAFEDTGVRYDTLLAGRRYQARILCAPGGGAFFVDCPALYDRDGLYSDRNNDSYTDNAARYALLSLIAVKTGEDLLGGPVDVLHAHDWQAGLVAAYQQLDPAAHRARTVFTIHNLAFQGIFHKSYVEALDLDWSMFTIDGLEFYDQVNFLKAGAAFSDHITTVSSTYAEEIKRGENGHGLAAFFRENAGRLSGILNGIDTAAWNPATDDNIAASYSIKDRAGKRECRRALCDRFGLSVDDDQLLCGVVSRLAMQKGPDLIAELVPKLSGIGAALVLLGSGDPALEHRFDKLSQWFSKHVSVEIGYDERLARQVFAGCDALLMPSRFEPCGLAQLSAMRYGTLPIVHAVGGLADTVHDPGEAKFAKEPATGFCFRDPDAGGLEWATSRAARLFRDDRPVWERTVDNAMSKDWSWDRAAVEYVELYRAE